MKKGTITIILVALTASGVGSFFMLKEALQYHKEEVPAAIDLTEVRNETTILSPNEALDAVLPLPEELNLKMAFYPQAPFANWDYPWQEACEEASVLLVVDAYYKHEWTREQFNSEILKLVEWENGYFGDYKHTDVQQTTVMLKKVYNLDSVIHEQPTFEDIQKILARGNLIVAPFAGKLLYNPYYKNGGPMYHVMVIKGYKEGQKIITADVGTRQGEDYVYSWEVFDNALHDLAEPIESGAPRIIEVLPPMNNNYTF